MIKFCVHVSTDIIILENYNYKSDHIPSPPSCLECGKISTALVTLSILSIILKIELIC